MEKLFYLRILVGLILFVSLVGCMDVRSLDKDKSSDDSAATAGGASHFVLPDSPKVQALSEAHHYQIIFPVHEQDGTVVVEREDPDQKKSMLMLPVMSGQAVDLQVQDGKTYRYRWGNVVGTKIEATSEAEVKVPLDLVIAGNLDPSSKDLAPLFDPLLRVKSFGRIFFEEHSIFSTQGQDLILKANEIISTRSLIQTFPAGSQALREGRSGGKLVIEAAIAHGDLKIEMRGEDGGPGAQGSPPDLNLKGPPGVAGAPAVLAFSRGMPPGGFIQEFLKCVSLPGNGGDGYPGRSGYKGFQGGRGGDSGRLEIRVKENSDFTVEWIREPGHGGEGGVGGFGGEGGDGGPPGPIPTNALQLREDSCHDAFPGNKGPSGSLGPSGDRGFEGRNQPVCILNRDHLDCQP